MHNLSWFYFSKAMLGTKRFPVVSWHFHPNIGVVNYWWLDSTHQSKDLWHGITNQIQDTSTRGCHTDMSYREICDWGQSKSQRPRINLRFVLSQGSRSFFGQWRIIFPQSILKCNVCKYTVLYKIICSSQWTLFITRSHLLFYFVFRTCSICFRTIYRLQMALGV